MSCLPKIRQGDLNILTKCSKGMEVGRVLGISMPFLGMTPSHPALDVFTSLEALQP